MLVQRYERAVLSNNKTLINLISNEIKAEIPRMRPMELVNAAKLSRSETLTHAIFAECKRRKYLKFKSQDFATLVSVKSSKCDDLRNAISTNMGTMRPGDLCFVLWKLNEEKVTENGLKELATRDLTRLTRTNHTQLLRVMSCARSEIPLVLVDSVVAIWIDLIPMIDHKVFPFVLYSFAEIVSKQRLESCSRLEDFFTLANAELVKRADMEVTDVIDSVRALGRIRRLEKEVFETRLVRDTLEKVDFDSLSDIRRKGINNAAVSVGVTSFRI